LTLLRGPTRWREAAFAVLDFETTGLDPARDHVLSFGVVRVEGGRIRMAESLYRVVRPPIAIPSASIRVHGIRPHDLANAPPLDDVVHELSGALAGRALVAHAAEVELSFLARLRQTHGLPAVRRAVDVLDLAHTLATRDRRAPRPTVRLADLAERHGVPVARTHHAFGDALTTAQLFLVLVTRLERLGVRWLPRRSRRRSSHVARTFASPTP
jgi:DNA polymerase-3 subunit epsilon